VEDHDRPLAPRGEAALARLRRYISRSHVAPTLVLCSSASRAVMTCNGIIAALPTATSVQIEDGLYAAPSERLLDRLRRVDHDIAGVLLIAHNPGLHSLATSLIGTGHDALREQLAAKFPTGALATLTLRGAWADLLPGSATLQAFVVPRALR
jgi:phosphohistidine phosphatase